MLGWAFDWDGGGRACIHKFGGKPIAECSLGRPRKRWEDNIGRIMELTQNHVHGQAFIPALLKL
jgi:hypothetical protein